MSNKEVSPVRHCMHGCEVVDKDVLERLTVKNSISVQHNAVCWCVGYCASTKTVDALLMLIFRRQ